MLPDVSGYSGDASIEMRVSILGENRTLTGERAQNDDARCSKISR
jgi:hypothetical protein